MKKFLIIALIFIVIIIAGIIGAEHLHKDKENETIKIGMILNGDISDRSWGQSHYEGMEKTKEKLNLEVIYHESVPQDEQCIEIMEELVSDGCNIIICNSYAYGEYELQVAKKYPELCFYHAAGVETSENLSTYFGRIYQMRYLTGIVAGLQTETDEIGYVAAFPISEVNRGINAFTLGVRSVNPDAKVYVEWCNSWTNEEESRKSANKLINEHNIDILTMHTDAMAPLEVAEENGIWSIGYNIDNSNIYPNSFLTAAIWNWGNFYTPRIQEYKEGKFSSQSYWESAETGIIDIAPFTTNVKPDIHEAVQKEKDKLESGTFDVFYGPITDTNGKTRVLEGESMSDNELLYEFDWYVDGVVTNVQ